MIHPKISIIIATKNAKPLLIQTLQNLHEQHYNNLEVIVIDGDSNDGTQEILENNADKITHWISEPDRGISDAFNKGLKLATGEYINFQGAGDRLSRPTVLQELFSDVDLNADLICGRVLRVKEDGITPIWVSPKHSAQFNYRSLRMKMSLPHQALFTHRRFFEQYGDFDNTVRFAMDYELLLRAYHTFPNTILKNMVVAHWRAGGVGTNRIQEIFDEYHFIKQKHQIANPVILAIIDAFIRFKYCVKTKILRLAY